MVKQNSNVIQLIKYDLKKKANAAMHDSIMDSFVGTQALSHLDTIVGSNDATDMEVECPYLNSVY